MGELSRFIVCTVGFDEKLVLRSLLRVGFGVTDVVVLVYSLSGGEYEVRRVESAVRNVKELLGSAGVVFNDIVVSGMDFAGDVAVIAKFLREHAGKASEVIGVVSGGMRLLIVETIVALLLFKRFAGRDANVRVHVEREDGLYSVDIPIDLFSPPGLTPRDVEVLKLLADEEKLSDVVERISRSLGISEQSAYKRLYRLKAMGLVEFRDHLIRQTLAGRLMRGVLG